MSIKLCGCCFLILTPIIVIFLSFLYNILYEKGDDMISNSYIINNFTIFNLNDYTNNTLYPLIIYYGYVKFMNNKNDNKSCLLFVDDNKDYNFLLNELKNEYPLNKSFYILNQNNICKIPISFDDYVKWCVLALSGFLILSAIISILCKRKNNNNDNNNINDSNYSINITNETNDLLPNYNSTRLPSYNETIRIEYLNPPPYNSDYYQLSGNNNSVNTNDNDNQTIA
jgi:hypothetical protein